MVLLKLNPEAIDNMTTEELVNLYNKISERIEKNEKEIRKLKENQYPVNILH